MEFIATFLNPEGDEYDYMAMPDGVEMPASEPRAKNCTSPDSDSSGPPDFGMSISITL